MTRPASPAIPAQHAVTPASTTTRARTAAGNTLSRHAASWRWNSPGFGIDTVLDIRAYYEELCPQLAGGVPDAWASEHWFYEETEAGTLIQAARRAMRDQGAPMMIWFYMAPVVRNPDV